MTGKCFPAAFLLLLMIPLIVHLGNGLGSEVHDVAVTQVIAWPNMTLPSYVRVNVTVENRGNVSETLSVTVHADNLTVTSATVIEMASGSNETLELACDLFPFRNVIFPRSLWTPPMPMIVNVTVWAQATVTIGEANTTDNVLVGGQVSLVWWWTDLNGDGRIDIIDIAIMARKFGSIGGWHPCWDLWPPLDGDGLLNILDMAHVAKDVGKDYGSVYYEPSNLDNSQWNPASFQYSRWSHLRSGIGPIKVDWYNVTVNSPLRFEMSSPARLFRHRFGINLTASTSVKFEFQATAPVYFRVGLEYGQSIISRITTIWLESEFYVEESGFYVFEFDPVQSNPDATITFDARLDC